MAKKASKTDHPHTEPLRHYAGPIEVDGGTEFAHVIPASDKPQTALAQQPEAPVTPPEPKAATPAPAVLPQVPAPAVVRAASFTKLVSAPQPAEQAKAVPVIDFDEPTYRVFIEIDGVPAQFEAWYHRVIKTPAVLVLCHKLGARAFPRTTLYETEADITVRIDGGDQVFVVQNPGIVFEHLDESLQILLIKSEHPWTG